jgi:hypothetical protein
MKGRRPVTLDRTPQPDADFLLDVLRIDPVLGQAVRGDQDAHLRAEIGQKALQALVIRVGTAAHVTPVDWGAAHRPRKRRTWQSRFRPFRTAADLCRADAQPLQPAI